MSEDNGNDDRHNVDDMRDGGVSDDGSMDVASSEEEFSMVLMMIQWKMMLTILILT